MRFADCHPERKHHGRGLCASCHAMAWAKANPRAHLKAQHKRYLARRVRLDTMKASPCTDCGVSFPPECMDWDHRDPNTKQERVGLLVMSTETAILTEIAKCDLVCANCHRIRTKNRRQAA